MRRHASALYLDGFDRLELPADEIPSLEFLNSRIPPASGWTVVRTNVRFTNSDDWYRFFDRKEFLITNYMRSREELDWTPEPDMFHDIFGHLPYFMLPEYAELKEMFAPAYLAATTDDEKENIKRLAWYSTEFGMIMEDGIRKVFGTGLMSGGDEFRDAAEGKLKYEPFTLSNVLGVDKVMYEQHDHLYVLESLEQSKAELAMYLEPIAARASQPCPASRGLRASTLALTTATSRNVADRKTAPGWRRLPNPTLRTCRQSVKLSVNQQSRVALPSQQCPNRTGWSESCRPRNRSGMPPVCGSFFRSAVVVPWLRPSSHRERSLQTSCRLQISRRRRPYGSLRMRRRWFASDAWPRPYPSLEAYLHRRNSGW